MVALIKGHKIEEIKENVSNIELVYHNNPPTKEQQERLYKYADTSASNGKLDNWYVLLKAAQGDPSLFMDGLTYMIDDAEFLKDSVLCEYAYVLNLDNNTLEFYEGFQKEPQKNNRYGTCPDKNGFYPVRLIATYTYEEIKNHEVDEIVWLMNGLVCSD